MYPSSFQYHRATSVEDALSLLATHGDDAKLLSGGHSLLPVLKLRFAQPAHLIDVSRISGLSGITDDGQAITIGATTRYADILASPVVKARLPVLADATARIGDPAVRNMGTIGGSLAHADPNADLPAVMLALNASITLTSATGQRRVAADDFFLDVFATALKSGEILTGVSIPVPAAGTGGAYEKYPDPASGYALAGVAAVITASGGRVSTARVAMTGLVPKATRLTAVESALTSGASVDAAAAKAADGLQLNDDATSSAAYKANLAVVFTRRALTRALSGAG